MTQLYIEQILKMRMAVYQAGISVGIWKDINQLGASDMMEYIYPKSGQVAYYNLIMEYMRKEHDVITGGAYFLYKMPVQIEKEIMEYLKKNSINLLELGQAPEGYLQSMDTIPTDHCFTTVNIGSFSLSDIDSKLRLCASHYRYSFQSGVKSYPYFE